MSTRKRQSAENSSTAWWPVRKPSLTNTQELQGKQVRKRKQPPRDNWSVTQRTELCVKKFWGAHNLRWQKTVKKRMAESSPQSPSNPGNQVEEPSSSASPVKHHVPFVILCGDWISTCSESVMKHLIHFDSSNTHAELRIELKAAIRDPDRGTCCSEFIMEGAQAVVVKRCPTQLKTKDNIKDWIVRWIVEVSQSSQKFKSYHHHCAWCFFFLYHLTSPQFVKK